MNQSDSGLPDTGNSPAPRTQQDLGASVDMPSRRRWLRAGLKASPVVLTLASQPVLAWQCKTPSAHASANLSRGTYQQVEYHKSPGTCSDWKTKFNSPSTPCYPTGGGGALEIPYPCSHTSSCSTLMGSGRTDSIKYVLNNGTTWEKACLTAMLNAKCGRVETYCADEADFGKMWREGDSYSSSAGKVWSKAMVVDYLSSTGFARP
jgi:hypothetical protein